MANYNEIHEFAEKWIDKYRDQKINYIELVDHYFAEVWENMDEGTLTATKAILDDMHKRKIDMADSIYVINVGGYIGDSTESEIAYAEATGKKVEYLEEKLCEY